MSAKSSSTPDLADLSKEELVKRVARLEKAMEAGAGGKGASDRRRSSADQQRLHDFAETASDWFWEMDADLRFTYLSDRIADHLLLGPDDILGKRRQDVAPIKEDPELWERHFNDLDNRRPFRDFRYWFVDPEGIRHHCSLTGKPIFDDDGEFLGYRGTGKSISAEIAAKEKAKNIESRLFKATDSLPVGIALFDPDDRLAFFNGRYKELSLEIIDLIKPGAYFNDLLTALIERGAVSGIDGREDEWFAERLEAHRNPKAPMDVQRGDRWMNVVEQVSPDGSRLHILQDATERKKAEIALVENERRLRQVIDSLPLALHIWDADDRLIMVNKTHLENWPEHVPAMQPGCHFSEHIRVNAKLDAATGSDAEIEAYVQRRLNRFHNSGSGEIETQKLNGRWLHAINNRMSDGSTISIRVDVTEMREKEEQLRQAQKMEAVGQLTGGLAHDFNNLLLVVSGNLELLSQELNDRRDLIELIERAQKATQSGAELTRNLLAFSRKQALAPRDVDLESRLPDLELMLRRTLGATIDIRTSTAKDLWHCLVDPAQMENSILNLALNARDAMPDGGKLTIDAQNVVLEEVHTKAMDEVEPGDYVKISVSDTGSGMTAETLERVFEPFFTTKALHQGSGLGLSMVFGYIKQSRGHVSIASILGEGTTVDLYLPRAVAANNKNDEPEAENTNASKGERVLVVEDHLDVRRLSVMMLKNLGYRVVDTGDGPGAMEILNQDTNFDLLLTDVVLPNGMSGPDIAAAAQKRIDGIRTVFMSGYTHDAIVHDGKLDDGIVLLQKPFRKADLGSKLRSVLDDVT